MQILPAIQSPSLPGNTAAKIDQVARQLEGQFAQLLIQSMRAASFGDALFPGENKLFHDLHDQQLANALTHGKGLGIAAMVARQLQGSPSPEPVPAHAQMHPATAAAAPLRAAASTVDGRVAAPLRTTASTESGRREVASPIRTAAGRVIAQLTAPVRTAATGVARSAAAHTPEHFVASIWQHAKRAAHELGVDVRALVAQAALETGWGKHGIRHADGRSSHNLFGIKADGWGGDTATVTTHEYRNGTARSERAGFRSYATAAESFADYVRLLKTSPRYRKALAAGGNVRAFATGLQQAGYATDPHYADKIHAIATSPTLQRALAAVDGKSTGTLRKV